MPRYEIPAFVGGPEEKVAPVPEERILYIPVNEDILDILDIDDEVEVKLQGQVVGLESQDLEYASRDFKLKVKVVEVYPAGNEFTELAIDDDEDEY